MAQLREVVVVGYVRTPFCKADPKRGAFRNVLSDDLAVVVLQEILARTGVAAKDVDGVMLGAVEMLGEQAHPGTAIPFLAGFPDHVIGFSMERACTTAMMTDHTMGLLRISTAPVMYSAVMANMSRRMTMNRGWPPPPAAITITSRNAE